METRPCGQLAPPGSAPRPGPGVAETPRRGASHARSRKKALVLVSTRRPSACSRGPPGGSAADQPDQEPRADAGSTPGGAPITPLRGAAPGSRGGRRPWALPGTSVELHSALPVGTSFQVRRAKAWCRHRSRHLMNPPPPPPLRS
ncbi:putative uncharacterized protein BRD3OS isoform X1 [Eptesicus fuscus]|uniref:putative uncharacterized protein BRD3OS isoform X1 n=1 Tax=Eptesicus fuscus TaxID=29078 RepID=UPI002404219A|nr:putative uncharacterized protein BRD3OS isoform X1 [Eptesicus fuscus]